MKELKREIELVVLSDIHLGTYGCHAKELASYLKSIKPEILVLNGDIIDIWQFKKSYWPKSHMKVIKHIINLAAKGTRVYYVTGNHDETFRRFVGAELGNITICNQLELILDSKRAWFFHGDVFDVVIQNSKWLAIVGSVSYDLLIRVNHIVNKVSKLFGKGKVSLSKKIKDNVKSAVKYINNFEETAAHVALQKGFEYIVCGHIHHAEKRLITITDEGSILYLNSGDWVENLTALEYNNKEWEIYQHEEEKQADNVDDIDVLTELDNKQIFNLMLKDFSN
jgi:UDP-2,3-diacylglucosamine pyrophosphatase LpxH